ncbi:subclass B3 metallo-beta-lactamase [Massilia sp. Dwa41.01b]|uniref:subclass B3 metallo-beta-lactamase n=1 Tax=unclassified Massilia TaxID=2609279 RepID=UPI0016032DC2|nr:MULTISPECIES: subclass B3 metallo-beta-lactamase [unclassified Massilia]QNA90522.1 subclass B3 metallo-beta-lactamase [Massilia sp. Dwa41.01b]QNA97754.1 subclass B3 metallo-beta-lactamase [Massilia sp. Se16.2.3]
MKRIAALLVCLSGLSSLPAHAYPANWEGAQKPFVLYGSTYYVGTQGLSSVLITSPAGHILIDGATPKAAPQIAAHIRELGFKLEDIRYILTSHEHFDHVGGVAELQRLTGATVLTSPAAKSVLESGKVDKGDPQHSDLADMDMPPVANVKTVRDGETVELGPLSVKANYTPGHTQGGISWTWSAFEKGRAMNMVYADSLNAMAAPPFRYSGNTVYPNAKADVERSIARVAALPCDILVTAHPDASDLLERQAKQKQLGNAAFVSPDACHAYAAAGRQRLARTLADEAKRGEQGRRPGPET